MFQMFQRVLLDSSNTQRVDDYPRALAEFERRFATEADCRAYQARLRWPMGFRCPPCAGTGNWSTKRALMMCTHCGHQASADSQRLSLRHPEASFRGIF